VKSSGSVAIEIINLALLLLYKVV